MIRIGSLSVFLCLLLAAPILAAAQEQTPPAPEHRQLEETQAFEMLESIAESIPALRSSDNRIFLTTVVADLLWSRDEKRARSMFETLTKEMSAAIASLDPSDQRSFNTLSMIQQRRRETVELLARCDPEMALTFLRATRPPVALRSQDNEYSSEANVELHLAGLLANKKPEQALQLARAQLKRGLSSSLISVLTQFGPKNVEAARTLHGEIVNKLTSANLITDYDAANVAWSLVGSFPPPQANEDTYRTLIEFMATAVLSAQPDFRQGNSLVQNSAHQIPAYMAQFEKYAPARAGALKQWTQQVKVTLDTSAAIYQEINDVNQNGTIEDLLALTGKYGREHHAQLLQYAVSKAVSTGDGNRARQIIMDFVPEGIQRTQMLEQLTNQMFWTSVNENKITEARQTLGRVKDLEQRFNLLMNLTNNIIGRGDKNQATSLLAEATALLDAMPANASKLGAQLQLAQSYSTIDSQQSVALLQSVILQTNRLVSAAAVLDGFENSYLKEGEWMKRGYTGLSNLVNSIEQNLGTLARVDVEGARSLSKQLERPEIRLMAQLEIARNLLSPGTNSVNYNRIIRHYPARRQMNPR
ncbi:MAG TPA: hypothetical protein VEW46_11820 [Pyrinomonadaceae bacterium]|nr:hypothetical protein [Pyrinomonadaceae bacterium]